MSSNMVSDTMKTVSIARNIKRPTAREFIDQLFDEFMEFHGDRYYADDGAIVGGIASFRGEPVTVIGIQKGILSKRTLLVILVSQIRKDTAKHFD